MKRYIDISQKLQHGVRGMEIRPKTKLQAEGWNSSDYVIPSDLGTHLAAPASYGMLNEDVMAYPVSRFISKAWIVNVPDVAPGDVLTCDVLGDIEDSFKAGESLILRTGWSQYENHLEIYRDKLPSVGRDLVEWCVRKNVNIIGVETPSIADYHNSQESQYIHRALFRGSVIVLEALTNLHSISTEYVDLYVFPLKIEDSDSCPARVVVVEDTGLQ